jgi:YVTN family beta-propeller protein
MPARRYLMLAALVVSIAACEEPTQPPVRAALLMAGPADTTVALGTSFQARATAFDARGTMLTDHVPQYQSLTPGVVTVTAGGLVTAEAIGTGLVEALLANLRDTIRVHVIDARVVARLPLSGQPYGVAVSSDGIAYVTRLLQGGAERLNIATRAFTGFTVTGSAPTQSTFNAAGTAAYVSNQFSATISVIAVATGTVTATIPTAGDPVPMQVRAAGDFLYYTTNLDRLYKATLPSGTVVDSLQLPATSHHLLLHPNDGVLYVATRAGGSVLEVDVHTLAVTRTFATGGQTQAMALAPDASELYVANEHGWLDVITLATGAVGTPIALGGGAFGLTLGPDGTKLFVGIPTMGAVRVVDRAAKTVVATIFTGGQPREMAVHAGGLVVVVANQGGWVDLVH